MFNKKIKELEQEIQKLKIKNLELTGENTELRLDNMGVAHYRSLGEVSEIGNKVYENPYPILYQ